MLNLVSNVCIFHVIFFIEQEKETKQIQKKKEEKEPIKDTVSLL